MQKIIITRAVKSGYAAPPLETSGTEGLIFSLPCNRPLVVLYLQYRLLMAVRAVSWLNHTWLVQHWMLVLTHMYRLLDWPNWTVHVAQLVMGNVLVHVLEAKMLHEVFVPVCLTSCRSCRSSEGRRQGTNQPWIDILITML